MGPDRVDRVVPDCHLPQRAHACAVAVVCSRSSVRWDALRERVYVWMGGRVVRTAQAASGCAATVLRSHAICCIAARSVAASRLETHTRRWIIWPPASGAT